jgi:hypothetical protein
MPISECKSSKNVGSPENSDLSVSYWVVAFLDLLGYRTVLDEFDIFPLPPEGPDRDAATMALIRSMHLRRRLLGILHKFLEAMSLPLDLHTQDSTQEYERLATTLRQIKMVRAAGPDHVILACSLMPRPGHNWIRALYTLVGACAATMLLQLSIGEDDSEDTLPLRGGIDVGLGGFDGDVLYSPAIAGAYELESEKAIYPRVIASNRLAAVLDSCTQIQIDGFESHYIQTLSAAIRDMFFEEQDTLTLDFFGTGVRKQLPADDQTTDIARKAWQFVCSNESRFRGNGKHRLQEKYTWLVEYMRPRLSLWGVQP